LEPSKNKSMTDDLSYWKDFWGNPYTPLHRYNTDKWYRLYAKEINLIFELFNVWRSEPLFFLIGFT
jgi:hypothetical protein